MSAAVNSELTIGSFDMKTDSVSAAAFMFPRVEEWVFLGRSC